MKATIPEAAKALAKRSKAPRREDTSRPVQTTAGVGHNQGPPIDPPREPPIAREAWSLDEFCASHGISKPLLYKLWKQGEGPQFMFVGARRYISARAAAAWRAALERQSKRDLTEIKRRSQRGTAIYRGLTKAERVAP